MKVFALRDLPPIHSTSGNIIPALKKFQIFDLTNEDVEFLMKLNSPPKEYIVAKVAEKENDNK